MHACIFLIIIIIIIIIIIRVGMSTCCIKCIIYLLSLYTQFCIFFHPTLSTGERRSMVLLRTTGVMASRQGLPD